MGLGLGLICKDEVERIDHILSTYGKYFSEIQITITNEARRNELVEVITKHGGVASYFKWCKDFSAARNFNKEQFKNSDYYFRMDCDDEITNPENIEHLYNECKEKDLSIMFCWYNYARDIDHNLTAGHYRESIIKIDPNLFWNKTIHENVLPKVKDENYTIELDKAQRVMYEHIKTLEEYEESEKRNLEFLIEEYQKDPENCDLRTIAYLGRTCYALKYYKDAQFFLEKHIAGSGWDEDRYMSWCTLAELMRGQKDYKQAIACCMEALAERPDYPDAYFKLHYIYLQRQDYKKAIYWAVEGFKKPIPQTFMILDISSYTWRPMMSLSNCYLSTGDYEKAYECFQYVKTKAPSIEFVKKFDGLYQEAYDYKRWVDKFLWLYNYTDRYEPHKLNDLVKTIPDKYRERDIILQVTRKNLVPKVWSDKSVVIFCPKVFEEWSPLSVDSGIGGSEEAVIYLAQEFQKLGYEVTVYNDCGEMAGKYNGVTYVPYTHFNLSDVFNILISWRSNVFATVDIAAKERWIWFHDVPLDVMNQSLLDRQDYYEKVVVLSEYHKSLLPKELPSNKILVSANGLNMEDFTGSQERNPHRVIYGSSYNRGLEQLLDVWPDVKKEVPDAELHVFYGWNNMEELARMDVETRKYIDMMNKKMSQPGVFEHGRIGHKELVKEYQKAGVWAYPCIFPEISCITAMKAQACGAVPVTNNFAALAETVRSGVVVFGEVTKSKVLQKYKKELINVLKDTKYQEELRSVAVEQGRKFTWEGVARQWASEWQKNPVLVSQ